MTKEITTLQAMSHPDVVATINALAEMSQRLQDENDALKKPWVGLTDEDISSVLSNLQVMYNRPPTTDSRAVFARVIEAKLKEKNT